MHIKLMYVCTCTIHVHVYMAFKYDLHVMCMQIHCPDDYRQWLVSMYSLFGTKFVKIYSGPMWRVETTSQDQPLLSQSKLPVDVCVCVHFFYMQN